MGGIHGRRLENGAAHALQAVLKVKNMKICGGNSTEGYRCYQSVEPPELNWK